MKVSKQKPFGVKLFLQESEIERFKRFLSSTGRKAAPFLKTLILKALEEWEAVQRGNTQIDINAFRSGPDGSVK